VIRIRVRCTNGLDQTFTIAAGANPGQATPEPLPHTFTGIPAGTRCGVTESPDGSRPSAGVDVGTTFSPSSGVVVIGQGGELHKTVHITDTYTHHPGQLIVTKTITGPGAGQQGAIVIGVTCGALALPDFTIGAGAPSGSTSHSYTNIPAPTMCTVIETTDGHTNTVAVAVTGGGQVTVPPGGTATIGLTNAVSTDPRTLIVNKTITGSAAGHQGAITIQVECNGTRLPDFTIPAGAPAGTTSHTYGGLPPDAACTLTEAQDGHTSSVKVTTTGDHSATLSTPGGATADLVDTYTGVQPPRPPHRPSPPHRPPPPPPPPVTG
jgi:hypothetical protein